MRRILIAVTAMVTVFWFATPTHATLWDRGSGLIYDDVLQITWLQDANYAMTSGYDADGQMTWDRANAWADSLEYAGYHDWRLPTGDRKPPDGNGELWTLYNTYHLVTGHQDPPISPNPGPFINFPTYSLYWSGTLVSEPGDFYYGYNTAVSKDQTYYGYYVGFEKNCDNLYAWAVRSGDVSAVPIPAAVWLLGSGLIGLIGVRRRFRK